MAITIGSTTIPDWLEQFYKDNAADIRSNVDIAKNIYNQNKDYQPYTGPRVADFTEGQRAGMDLARSNVGAANDALAFSEGAIASGAQSYGGQALTPQQVQSGRFDTAAAQQYMSPYTQTALRSTLDEMARQNELGALADNARAAKAGAFGGSRQAIVDAERDRNFQRASGDMIAQAYDKAFTQGAQQFNQDQQRGLAADIQNQNMALQSFNANRDQFNTDQQRQLAAGTLALNSAPIIQSVGMQDANNLLNVGGMEQNLAQRNMDIAYGDFLAQRQYPYQQYGFLQNAVQNSFFQPNVGQTVTTQTPSPSGWQQAAGLGIAGLGLLGNSGAFGSGSTSGWLSPALSSVGSGISSVASGVGNVVGSVFDSVFG